YVFSVLAAQTSQTADAALYADLLDTWRAHRDARDALVALIAGRGETPVPAAPSYVLPNDASDATKVRAAALEVQTRTTNTYGTLVARTAGDDRRLAIRSVDESAVRQLRFGGRPEIFPGTGGLGAS
ncbi:MAG: hypothetical protein JWO46_2055, partial [Nocardioidaceae bacterium]|nr:hypothetical protein [Nocardioidaceae bacterium]